MKRFNIVEMCFLPIAEDAMEFYNKIPVIIFAKCKIGKGVCPSSWFSSSLG